MATTNLNIRIDKTIKDQAEEIFNELGLNMTTAVNMFLRTAIRELSLIHICSCQYTSLWKFSFPYSRSFMVSFHL